ncbi:hypothetical protein HMPREF0322_05276 [Desulfitobacterium hafniense DP7]|uniref:Uncharacterized protein n=1 Tax=Desulfitobacterium hafniense DP7 TaxID=537010 RepID=G9XWA9_DESHA|nr:hypothetical protein HMPREF0322_05276 [Desulfitobacterium hafniense DP7]
MPSGGGQRSDSLWKMVPTASLGRLASACQSEDKEIGLAKTKYSLTPSYPICF